jgi:hypothetical protein
MNITLPILHHSNTTATLKELALEYSYADCDTRQVTFYTINAISPFTDEGVNFSSIHSNGTEYICTFSYGELWEKLK